MKIGSFFYKEPFKNSEKQSKDTIYLKYLVFFPLLFLYNKVITVPSLSPMTMWSIFPQFCPDTRKILLNYIAKLQWRSVTVWKTVTMFYAGWTQWTVQPLAHEGRRSKSNSSKDVT